MFHQLFALTVTVWSPVYIAAASVDPGAIAIALPIVLAHVVGLPTSIFVLVRLCWPRHSTGCGCCSAVRAMRTPPTSAPLPAASREKS